MAAGWQQLTLYCSPLYAEHIAGLLEQANAQAISFPSCSDERQCLQALFNPGTNMETLSTLLSLAGAESVHHEQLLQQDWLALSRAGWQPMDMGAGVWVGPDWCEPPPRARLYLRIEPAQAFGTGRHPTTRLCLQWLVQQDSRLPADMIDYGCGSGILAIAAACLGVARVRATDIDPLSLQATLINAANNRVADRLEVVEPTVLAGSAPAPLLVANILLRPLIALAPRLADLVAADGQILLSGLTREQVTGCRAAYAHWFEFAEPRYDGEWALLHGRRLATE